MAVAKYIYLPVTQDTKEGDSSGNHKKAYKKFLSSFAILYYLSFGAFLLEGHDRKVAEGKRPTIQNFTFTKALDLSFRASSVL